MQTVGILNFQQLDPFSFLWLNIKRNSSNKAEQRKVHSPITVVLMSELTRDGAEKISALSESLEQVEYTVDVFYQSSKLHCQENFNANILWARLLSTCQTSFCH